MMGVNAAETRRLWLQPLSEESHLEDYHKIMTSPECLAWSRKTVHSSLEETRQLIYTTTPTDIDPWRKVYAIVLRPEATEQKSDPCLSVKSESPRMIGVLGTPREFELAYKIHSDFWGKGYMSEALEAYIDLFWKENQEGNVLQAYIDPENIRSVRVVQKAGFKNSTISKNQYIRSINVGSGKKSSLQLFWLGRPGIFEPLNDRSSFYPTLGVNEERHEELKNAINEMFQPR